MKKKWLASTFFMLLLSIFLISTFENEVLGLTTPKVAIVSLDHVPFVEGDNNEFYISAAQYTGEVQYQLFYIQESTMSTWALIENEDMVDGWTKAVDAKTPTIVSISNLQLKADKYRFAIRVRRVGVKGLKSNSYGDYDDAYPFNLDVVKKATIELSGNVNIEKTDFSNSENLIINGVGNLSSDVQYKLHLFDVKNNKWLTNLTEYSSNVNYNLKDISEGIYIVDLWSKNLNSNNSYDGWKLKTITVRNGLQKNGLVFKDKNLEALVRTAIGKPTGNLTANDVKNITELYVADNQVKDISGLEQLTNLQYLSLESTEITDISVLKNLTNLTDLCLDNTKITDISALKDLNNLTDLSLNNNKINDISALRNLTNLKDLSLNNTFVTDISTLRYLPKLTNLSLDNNKITDISTLRDLTNLTDIYLDNNKISDISVLKNLNKLTTLSLNNNRITDISALKGFKFIYLSLNSDEITNMDEAFKLYAKANEITKLIIKPGMTELEKEKAVHDYIIFNTKHNSEDYRWYSSSNAYGVLLNGSGVSDGYASATQLLLNMAGISSVKVMGFLNSNGTVQSHAWNIVEIDGVSYHVDTTLDDPTPDMKNLAKYDYFNLTDSKISGNHTWNQSSYPVCDK
jgi:Leucine-rich repeat (LRR) protein